MTAVQCLHRILDCKYDPASGRYTRTCACGELVQSDLFRLGDLAVHDPGGFTVRISRISDEGRFVMSTVVESKDPHVPVGTGYTTALAHLKPCRQVREG